MTTLVAPAPVRDRVPRVPTRVSWTTVLPLAVVGAFGSGFWVVALRGAVGPIERINAPFASWLRESAVLVPVYVFAVLAAVTLALRWFGQRPLRGRATAATLLLVVSTVTVAGVVVLTANTVYDFLLQSQHMSAMPVMDTACDAACDATRRHSTLTLQVRSVGLGSLLILVTNLALLSLLVALRGGRIPLVARRPRSAERPAVRTDQLRLLVAGCLGGAAAIHAGVAPDTLDAWAAAGWFFVVLSVVQATLAVIVVRRTSDAVVWAVLVVSEAAIVLWLVSRTLGLPFGPGADVPEALGLSDIAATALETLTLVTAVALLRGHRWLLKRRPAEQLGRLALAAVIAVGVAGLGSSLSVFGGPGLASPHHPSSPESGAVTTSVGHETH